MSIIVGFETIQAELYEQRSTKKAVVQRQTHSTLLPTVDNIIF